MKKWKSLLALLLVCAIVVATPAPRGAWGWIDLAASNTLTVIPGGMEVDDLDPAELVIDLYRVGDAVKIEGVDAYTLQGVGPYAGLQLNNNQTFADWETVAQQAAAITFGDEALLAAPAYTGFASETFDDVQAGLYLLVAHGTDVDPYIVAQPGEEGAPDRYVTVAQTDEHIYHYSPVLVALPSKPADPDGHLNTANPGEWSNHVTATLKPEQRPRYGDMEIVKTLNTFVQGEPATFVFLVEAWLHDKLVYSEVFTITFTGAGQESLLLEKCIPVGAQVVVTEVWSGASYTLTTENDQTCVIDAEELVGVTFENEPDITTKEGGSINNQFTDRDENGWRDLNDVKSVS